VLADDRPLDATKVVQRVDGMASNSQARGRRPICCRRTHLPLWQHLEAPVWRPLDRALRALLTGDDQIIDAWGALQRADGI
jgi:hypothetical protein